MYRMENWSVVALNVNPYGAPETGPKGLHGNVYDNPGFEDGTPITTSQITGSTVIGDRVVIRTQSGSEYLLGTVDLEYEKTYPKALERLIKALK